MAGFFQPTTPQPAEPLLVFLAWAARSDATDKTPQLFCALEKEGRKIADIMRQIAAAGQQCEIFELNGGANPSLKPLDHASYAKF